jgi:hypothetical protein
MPSSMSNSPALIFSAGHWCSPQATIAEEMLPWGMVNRNNIGGGAQKSRISLYFKCNYFTAKMCGSFGGGDLINVDKLL